VPPVTVKLAGWTTSATTVTTVNVPPADPLAVAMAGETAERTAQVAERALASIDLRDPVTPGSRAWNTIRALVAAERDDAALHALDQASEAAYERGTPFDVHAIRVLRAEYHLRIGDLDTAEADARALHESASGFDWPAGEAWAVALLAEVLVERGELDDAAALFAAGGFSGPARLLRHLPSAAALLFARGRLRRAQGRIDDAVDDLREAGERATLAGCVNPALVPWRSDLSLALHEAGDDEAADLAHAELTLARRFGAPRALGVALRAAARVRDEVSLLHESARVLDESMAPLERARTLIDLGEALHDGGDLDEARDVLRVAVDLAHHCGAGALEDVALAGLRATGAKPRRLAITGAAALTRSERRIAELAAAGRMNREIADELVVTLHTVEFHLRNAYRKLGIKSRNDLPEALAPEEAEGLALAA